MADDSPNPSAGGDTSPLLGGGSTGSTTRWPKVLGIIALVVFLLGIVLAHLTGRIGPGNHGPGRPVPSSSVTEETPTDGR